MKRESGFIQFIIIIIIALAALKYVFDFDIIEFLNQPKIAETIDYVWSDIIVFLWINYLGAPVIWAWNLIIELAKLGWENLLILLDKIKEIILIIKE